MCRSTSFDWVRLRAVTEADLGRVHGTGRMKEGVKLSNDEFERDGCEEGITEGESAIWVPKVPILCPQSGPAGAGSLCGVCNGWLLKQGSFAGGCKVGLLEPGSGAVGCKVGLRELRGFERGCSAWRFGPGTLEAGAGDVLPRQKMPGDVDFSCRTGAESFFMQASAPATDWGESNLYPTACHAYLRRPSLG